MYGPYGTTQQQYVQNICKQCHHEEIMDDQVQPNIFTPPLDNLSSEVRQSLDKLFESFKSKFMKDGTSNGMTNLTKIQTDMGNSEPVSQKTCPIVMEHFVRVKDDINKLLDAKVICSTQSSWSISIIVVPKGNSGKCLVIDYRNLNKVTQKVHLDNAQS